MRWSLILGRIAGIKILVHWTFLILIGWVVFTELSKGNDWNTIFVTVTFVLAIFLCVVLHELGHALMARRYHIETKKITLLPIGGVAALERMPSDPKKELLIAVAGPAVNVVIALLLMPFVSLSDYQLTEEEAMAMQWVNFIPMLLLVNIILVVFNAIPAFPMDGGRVLRALLAFRLNRVKATQIASGLGQLIAIGFVVLAFVVHNPFLVLIGVFVFFGAYSENRIVQHLEFLRGYTVRDAMMTNFATVAPEESVQQVLDKILSGSDKDFVVVEGESIIGTLSFSDLIGALKEEGGHKWVRDVMKTDFKTIPANEKLPQFFAESTRKKEFLYPVVENGRLVGVINRENLNEFVVIKNAMS